MHFFPKFSQLLRACQTEHSDNFFNETSMHRHYYTSYNSTRLELISTHVNIIKTIKETKQQK